jgi:FO synthase subunit 2
MNINIKNAPIKNISEKLDGLIDKAISLKHLDNDDLFLLLEEKENVNDIIISAEALNEAINSNKVSYVVNRNINFTNICYLNCKFCGYQRTARSKDSFVLDFDKILEKIKDGYKIGIDEICLTGGINPELNAGHYFNMIKTIRKNFPALHIHAFSPQEVFELSNKTGYSYEKVISILVENGLNSMPGTAAEILSPETRAKICPQKISADKWVEIIKTAHKIGVKTSATILFGHIESHYDIVHHLNLIREIQKETGGFTEFIALPFIPFKTSLRTNVSSSISEDDVLKFYAIFRLYLYNFKNIQTSWPKIGVKSAIKSLSCGVNDFGGTLMEENITKSAGGDSGEYLSEKEIIALIKSAGKVPVRRDTLYNYI